MKHQIDRTVFIDPGVRRIDVLDNRFYFHVDDPEIFYPSTTTILEVYPKDYALEQWHKAMGFNSDIILKRQAEKGSNVHNGVERYLNGQPLFFGEFYNDVFVPNYTLEEWEMLCKFVEFWELLNPELIASEVVLLSTTYKLGMTIDLIFKLLNIESGQWENWLIDIKCGNYVQPSHELQVAAYAMAWNEQHPDCFINRWGILHLAAKTRGEDKSGKKIQGKGWNVVEYDRHYKDAFKVFKHLRAIWDDANPDYKPKTLSLPSVLELKKIA